MPHKIFLTAAFSKQVQWEQVQKRKSQLKGTTAGKIAGVKAQIKNEACGTTSSTQLSAYMKYV